MKLTGLKEKQQGIYENTKIAYLNFQKTNKVLLVFVLY